MSSFTETEVELSLAGYVDSFWDSIIYGRKRYRVETPFRYYTYLNPKFFTGESHRAYLTEKIYIEIEKGFLSDLGTVPRLAWWFIKPDNPDYVREFLLHDKCYKEGLYNKEWADNVFLEAMIVLGKPASKRALLYSGCTMIGKGSY